MGQEGLGGRKEGRVGERRPGGVGLPAVTSGLSAITFINPSGSHYLAATSGPCRPCPRYRPPEPAVPFTLSRLLPSLWSLFLLTRNRDYLFTLSPLLPPSSGSVDTLNIS